MDAKESQVLNSCPGCGADSFRALRRPRVVIGEAHWGKGLHGMGLVRCKACGLEFVSPRPNPGELMRFYARAGYTAHGDMCGQEGSYEERMRELVSLCSGRRLLDVGCGGGGFLGYAREAGWSVFGVEPSPVGRDNAAKKGHQVFEDVSAARATGVFDVVSLWHVLEHVPELGQTLTDVSSLLAPEGLLAVEVPNQRSLRARILGVAPWADQEDDRYRAFPIHLYSFTRRALVCLLERSGFSVVKTQTTYACLGDIFRRRQKDEHVVQGNAGPPTDSIQTANGGSEGSRLSRIKRLLLRMGLGEHLLVIARKPSQETP